MNDSYVYPAVILPLFLSLIIITRLLTTLFHELGHATPALIFTKDKVTIFLGSYGDIQNSKKVQLSKRLEVYFMLNPLKWNRGMVRNNSLKLDFFKKFIILSLGPLVSLIVASVALWAVFTFDFNGFLKLFTLFFFISALFDLRNLYPDERPILLIDGSYSYCDGFQMLRLIKFRTDSKHLFSAYDCYNNKDYKEAIKQFERLSPNFISADILNIVVDAFHKSKDYKGPKEFYDNVTKVENRELPNADNLCNIGVVESNLGNDERAMEFYNSALELDKNHIYSLCNRAYTYNLLGQYTEALADFDHVIKIDSSVAYAYANRAFTKIKLKLYQDGLIDIDKAITVDEKNAYAYRNLGVYYLEIKNYIKAREKLQRAYELDPDTHMINDYIKAVKEKLNEI